MDPGLLIYLELLGKFSPWGVGEGEGEGSNRSDQPLTGRVDLVEA